MPKTIFNILSIQEVHREILDEARLRQELITDFERSELRRHCYFLQQGSMMKKKMDKLKDYKER